MGIGIGSGKGGRRPGAGRPRDSIDKRKRAERRRLAVREQKLPLDLMLSIINDPSVSEARRDKFIIAAAPYLHPRLTTIAIAKAPFEMTDVEIEQTLHRQQEYEARHGFDSSWRGRGNGEDRDS